MNLERTRARRVCREFEVVTADVTTYEIPGDVTIVDLYNPFTGPVVERFVDNLRLSIERTPRPVRIVYANPVEEELLLAAGARHVRTLGRWRPTREWARREQTRIYSLGASRAA
jgi:hypothetical protein